MCKHITSEHKVLPTDTEDTQSHLTYFKVEEVLQSHIQLRLARLFVTINIYIFETLWTTASTAYTMAVPRPVRSIEQTLHTPITVEASDILYSFFFIMQVIN